MSFLKRLKASRLRAACKAKLANGDPITYRGLTVPVSADHMPLSVLIQIAQNNYEAPEIQAIEKLVREGDRVLEMGTGLGIVSGLTSRMAPNIEIRSFEANSGLHPHIRKLHELNDSRSVHVENAMLEPAPDNPTRPFHLHTHFPEGSVVRTVLSTETVDIPVQDLNHVIADFRPTMMVCDIEGAEEFIFPSAELGTLRALVLEMHPKVLSREGVKGIFDACARHGLYPRIEYSSEQVVAFERV